MWAAYTATARSSCDVSYYSQFSQVFIASIHRGMAWLSLLWWLIDQFILVCSVTHRLSMAVYQ